MEEVCRASNPGIQCDHMSRRREYLAQRAGELGGPEERGPWQADLGSVPAIQRRTDSARSRGYRCETHALGCREDREELEQRMTDKPLNTNSLVIVALAILTRKC